VAQLEPEYYVIFDVVELPKAGSPALLWRPDREASLQLAEMLF